MKVTLLLGRWTTDLQSAPPLYRTNIPYRPFKSFRDIRVITESTIYSCQNLPKKLKARGYPWLSDDGTMPGDTTQYLLFLDYYKLWLSISWYYPLLCVLMLYLYHKNLFCQEIFFIHAQDSM